MKAFFTRLFLFSSIIATADFFWMRLMPPEKHIPHYPIILLLFVGITTLFHFLTLQAAKGKPQSFIRYYMVSALLRMALYMVIIISYRFINKPLLIPFATGFLIHYFLFTAFEVFTLLKTLK